MVMSGQVLDVFDQDFRELYAISEKLNLYKEFHVNPPAAKVLATTPSKAEPKRPFAQTATSRFQVTLGDSPKADVQVPAHKYYNPKYLLVTGDISRPTGSLQDLRPKKSGSILPHDLGEINAEVPQQSLSEKMDRLSPLLSEADSEIWKAKNKAHPEKKGWNTLKKRLSKKPSSRPSVSSQPEPVITSSNDNESKSIMKKFGFCD